jgi:hypothetical protein
MASDSPTAPPEGNHLSDADRQAIAVMIASAFAQVRQDNLQQVATPASNVREPSAGMDTLKSEEVGLFNPDVEDSTDLNAGITTVGRHTVYKDVFAFTDRLTHLSKVRSEGKLWEIFPTLLRGSALVWHSVELSDMERDYLMTCPIDRLMHQLIKRFKKQASVALQALTSS